MTLEEAKALRPGTVLHHIRARNSDGSRQRCRVNGKVQTWKKNLNRVSIPIKIGMYEFSYINEDDIADWYFTEDAAIQAAVERYWVYKARQAGVIDELISTVLARVPPGSVSDPNMLVALDNIFERGILPELRSNKPEYTFYLLSKYNRIIAGGNTMLTPLVEPAMHPAAYKTVSKRELAKLGIDPDDRRNWLAI